MKNFKLCHIALGVLLLVLTAPLVRASTGRHRVVWSGDASSTATIGWDQLEGENPVVCYGTEDFGKNWERYPLQQKPTRKVLNYRGMDNHFAGLTGLQPDQACYFVIKDSQGTSERYWFKTAPDKPEPFTFIAGGDTKSQGSALEAGRLSNRMVAKLRPLFVVFVGDFCTGSGTNAVHWQQWMDDWSQLTVSGDGRMYPLVPVHGNHEDGDKSVLHNLFDVPTQYGNDENVYFDMSFGGNFAFLSLNSQIDVGGDQKKWIEERLKLYQDCTFVAAGYHKPFFPHTQRKPENENQYKQWAPLFYEYGLDLSFDGDSHMEKITFPLRPSREPGSHQGFIRDDENGTMYIGEGSWGASPRPADDEKPWTLRSGKFNQFKWMHVFPGQNGKPARIDIRTVITATVSRKGKKLKLKNHVEGVKALSEEDVFAIPENLKIFSPDPYGDVIRYPFNRSSAVKSSG